MNVCHKIMQNVLATCWFLILANLGEIKTLWCKACCNINFECFKKQGLFYIFRDGQIMVAQNVYFDGPENTIFQVSHITPGGGGGRREGGTHMLRHTGMCHPNGLGYFFTKNPKTWIWNINIWIKLWTIIFLISMDTTKKRNEMNGHQSHASSTPH